jgi:hypothetical protein
MNEVNEVRYPEVRVRLSGEDGNAFAILGAVRRGLTRCGVSKEEVERFVREATAGDYDNLIATAMKWVEVY